MKRLALLPAVLLLLCLWACTGPVSPTPAPTASAVPATPEPSAAPATPAPTPEPTPTATRAPEPTPDPTPEPEETLTVEGRDYPARRFTGDLAGSGGAAFSCVLPAEAVTAAYEHNAWVFRSTETPEAFLELSFIAGGDVESLLPGLMDGYLAFTEIEFSEASSLGRIRGDVGRVSAVGDTQRAEGWLLDSSGGVVAAALVCPVDAAEAEALLLAVLGTFTLN